MQMVYTEMLQYYQYSTHAKDWLLVDNNTTVMLMWCIKQLKDFILKFSISLSFFLQKAFLNLLHCNTCLFSFRWMCSWGCRQLSKLLPNWLSCSFPSESSIDSHTFHESWRTLSDYQNYFLYIHLFKPLLMTWTQLKLKGKDEMKG